MPMVLCPACAKPTTLPDPWPHPAYICPYCFHTAVLAVPIPPPTPPPPPANPFELDDAPTRPRPRRRGDHTEGAHPLLIIGGFLCALFSLVVFPPALGISGLVFGSAAIRQGSVGPGMLVVIFSLVFATIGMIWGAEVQFFGRPRFLLD